MAKSLSIKERKEWAKTLYLKEPTLTQKAIALRVGVSENSLSRWIKDEEWEKLRKNLLLTREEQLHKMLQELEEINTHIASKNEGLRFADSKLADVRRKLVRDIKDLETKANIAEVVSVCARIVEWVSKTNLEQAKELTHLFDAFIKDNLR